MDHLKWLFVWLVCSQFDFPVSLSVYLYRLNITQQPKPFVPVHKVVNNTMYTYFFVPFGNIMKIVSSPEIHIDSAVIKTYFSIKKSHDSSHIM